MELLYVSPFWPQKSGISEYSETLVWGLIKYFSMTILTKKSKISNIKVKSKFKVLKYSAQNDYSIYDIIIYNFGNSPSNHDYMYDMLIAFPGYIIMHDFSLYYLMTKVYSDKNEFFRQIYYQEKINTFIRVKDIIKEKKEYNLLDLKELAADVPLNREIILKAKGIFVHSEYTKNLIRNISNTKVCKIDLVNCIPELSGQFSELQIKKKYGFKNNDFVIGSVGLIAPSKQNKIICETIKNYNKTHNIPIKYIMIGEGDYINEYLDENIVKTDFVHNDEFFSTIDCCDLIFNLRYPYNGESSASLIQCLYKGKHCVVTDIGWFSELPDSCVEKVPVLVSEEMIMNICKKHMGNKRKNEVGKKYVIENCDRNIIAKKIKNFICNDIKNE